MKRSSLFLKLLLISWIASSGQVPASQYGPPIKDSTKCYTPTELKAIALKLISGQECDTLLKIANKTISIKDTVIASQDRTIKKEEERFKTSQTLANQYKTEKEKLTEDLDTQKKKTKWIIAGWAGTSLLLLFITALALL